MNDFLSRISSTKFLSALGAAFAAVGLAISHPDATTISLAIGAVTAVAVAYNVSQAKIDRALAEKGDHRQSVASPAPPTP